MSQYLPYLLILACPIAMGAMMWVMMRGMDHGKQPDPRVAELESQVAELRAAVTRPRQPAGVVATGEEGDTPFEPHRET
ncbi:MAG TPA: DUF2933 domain-containing protein [Candidatus Acidoferrales bacterium]|nr:DUF2933 domain-containing protein [Candidatus Acidoferrales bacterium]